MKLFARGKGAAPGPGKAPVFSPIDRFGLLGLLDQVVNSGQTGVLELREPRGTWVFAFQAGALTHASGGRVRGARQAFDLLWEFQSGEFMFTPGVNPNLPGNLYIDKGRLVDLLRRSQAVLQGPSAPYIPPDQQRPIAPVNRPYTPPAPGQMPPAWQPGAPPGQYAPGPLQGAPQGWPPAQPGMPQGPQPGMPPAAYPAQPPYPAGQYPGAPYPAPAPGQPYPSQPFMQPGPGRPLQQPPGYPIYPQGPGVPPQAMPQPPPAARPPARPVTPPSFSVPPMPIPKKREALPTYQPPAGAPPAPQAPQPAMPGQPKDDLAALRASLVAQAPPVRPAPTGASWAVRTADGTVAPPPPGNVKGGGKGKAKKAKRDSRLMAAIKVELIKFLLWACERRYSPEDHWTLKDAFEVSTMELRDQFIGAFSQSLKSTKKTSAEDDDMDDMAAGRMRGRGRRH